MKLAFISTGHIHMKDFARAVKLHPQIEIAGVFDTNPKLAAKWSKDLNTPVVSDYRQILDDKSIEAVVVAGTTAEHADYVVLTALAGKKLYAEKPLATSSQQAHKMFRAIKEAGVIFQTGHFMRSDEKHRFVKQEIEAGNFGTITQVRGVNCHEGGVDGWFEPDYRWLADRTDAGGGGFMDLGCHSVDLLVYLFGPVASVAGTLGGKTIRYPHIDEYGQTLLKFANGITGSVAAGWVSRRCPVKLEIDGTEGHLHIDEGRVFYFSKKSQVPGADASAPIDPKYMPARLPRAFELYLDVLEGKADPKDLISIEDAYHVAKTMEAVYLSDKIGSWVKV